VPDGDGCAASELAFWFSDKVIGPKEKPAPGVKPKPAKQMMLADLPAACRTVLDAPEKNRNVASDGRR
jgi:penicillin-insensitive murein endopeptidase